MVGAGEPFGWGGKIISLVVDILFPIRVPPACLAKVVLWAGFAGFGDINQASGESGVSLSCLPGGGGAIGLCLA